MACCIHGMLVAVVQLAKTPAIAADNHFVRNSGLRA